MKVDTKASGTCRVKLTIKAEAAETRPDYEEIVNEYVRHGRLPGFRPGKAPRPVVQTRYRTEIDGDVRSRLIGKFYREALKEIKLTAVAVVDVTDVIFSPETGISFVALVDVAPDFKLPKYKKIPLKIETPAVTEEQVNAQVDRLRNMMARFEEAAPGQAAARGDLVCIDYAGTCEGKPLQEIVPEAAGLAGGNDFWAQVDVPEFIPGLALALEGLKPGEEKDLKVKFEKDFHLEAMRGRKVEYRVKAKSVRVRNLPADEDICQRAGFANLDELRTRSRKELLVAAERKEEARQQQEVVDFLLKRTEFDLPESVVAEETNLTMRGMVRDIVGRGATREDIEKNRDAILGAASSASKDRVRLRYILSRIADEEKVAVADAEVQQRLQEMAAQHRMPLEKLRATIEERHGLESLTSDIRNEKALAQLVADAKAR
ncbi:MAG: trigger factor [bacterium]